MLDRPAMPDCASATLANYSDANYRTAHPIVLVKFLASTFKMGIGKLLKYSTSRNSLSQSDSNLFFKNEVRSGARQRTGSEPVSVLCRCAE